MRLRWLRSCLTPTPKAYGGAVRGARGPRSCGCLQQVPHPNEVVRRGPEEEDPVDQRRAPVAGFPVLADGLQPPEDRLDAFPAPLAERVPRVAGGAAVDGAPAMVVA